MAKQEAWKPPLNWIIAAVGSFPARRGEGDVAALEHPIRVCRAGCVIAMFPEGTRRAKGLREKHEPRPHTGAGRIALGAGVPLVPAALRGLDRLSEARPDAAPVRPADPARRPADLDAHAAPTEATRRLWAEIQRLEAEPDAEINRRPRGHASLTSMKPRRPTNAPAHCSTSAGQARPQTPAC